MSISKLALIQMLEFVAQEVSEKNIKYGDSFYLCPRFLLWLYPSGISADKLVNAIFIIRILDKISRLAVSAEGDEEDPLKDILGYSMLAYYYNRQYNPDIIEKETE